MLKIMTKHTVQLQLVKRVDAKHCLSPPLELSDEQGKENVRLSATCLSLLLILIIDVKLLYSKVKRETERVSILYSRPF